MNNLPQIDLSEGGKIVVLGGSPQRNWPMFMVHPQIEFWDADKDRQLQYKDLPSNTKALLCSRFLGHAIYNKVAGRARKRHIKVYGPLGTNTIAEILFSATKPPVLLRDDIFVLPEKVSKIAVIQDELERLNEKGILPVNKETIDMVKTNVNPQGKLIPLMPFIDPNKTASDNADVLLAKAKEFGIHSTRMSLINFVRTWAKRNEVKLPKGARGRTTGPRMEKRKTSPAVGKDNDAIVGIIDNIINELKDLRDYVAKTNKENQQLRKRMSRLADMFNLK